MDQLAQMNELADNHFLRASHLIAEMSHLRALLDQIENVFVERERDPSKLFPETVDLESSATVFTTDITHGSLPTLVRGGMLTMLIAYLEHSMMQLVRDLGPPKSNPDLSIKHTDSDDGKIGVAYVSLTAGHGIDLKKLDGFWEHLKLARRLRNKVVHDGQLIKETNMPMRVFVETQRGLSFSSSEKNRVQIDAAFLNAVLGWITAFLSDVHFSAGKLLGQEDLIAKALKSINRDVTSD